MANSLLPVVENIELCSISPPSVVDSCEAEIQPSGPEKGRSDEFNSDPLSSHRNPVMQSEVMQLPVNAGSPKPKSLSSRRWCRSSQLEAI